MTRRKPKGNMYEFADTWNPLGGCCIHNCSYCYVPRLMKQFPALRKKYSGNPRIYDLKKNLGSGNFWFVQSMSDLFAENVPDNMIYLILNECCLSPNNTYFFQSKNPQRFHKFINDFPENTILCITIETNKQALLNKYSGGNLFIDRIQSILNIARTMQIPIMVTIEPIMDFNLWDMVGWFGKNLISQVNIGADSGHNNLPEPSKGKILELIFKLEKFTKVYQKPNLKRLII